MPKPTSLDRDSSHRDRTAPRNVVLTRHPAPHRLFRRFPSKWLGRAAQGCFDFPCAERFYRRGAAGPYDCDHDRACSISGRRAGAARTFQRL